MDQEKIGKFIAQLRKEKKLTQQELANKLGVSDRTVGNWENGRNMPDLSLFKPLCEELGITINDFLSGERINEKEYSKKSEENIINTITYTSKKINKNKKILSRVVFLSTILVLLLGVVVVITFKDNYEKKKSLEEYEEREEYNSQKYYYGYTIGDGRHLMLTMEVPYCTKEGCESLGDVLMDKKLAVKDFLKDLEMLEYLKDGASIIYYYDSSKKTYGYKNFYVAECHGDVKDIFIAQDKKALEGKCKLKYDDLEGVSMHIKEGTLTDSGATVIIRDTSNRKNIYGEYFRIDRKENNEWVELDTAPQENGAAIGFNNIGYMIGETHEREFVIHWEWIYGHLPKGEYRIVKDTSEAGEGTEHYITTTFILP